MLDRSDVLILAEKINALPCHVKLTEALRNGLERTGPMPSGPDDGRRSPRHYYRGSKRRAAVEYRGSLPALPRAKAWFNVYLGNVARQGIGFLHHEPLFPLERMRVILPIGAMHEIEVKWCRRLGDSCYEIGARLAAELSAAEMREFMA